MPLFHLHDDFAAPARENRVTLARAAAWLAATLSMIHESILVARMRRLQCELTLHADSGEALSDEQAIGKIPQRPMILGDKWDF